tara:strand:+ start:17 stop:385 length:369 start_codon:yes stop_codon:yes gene_type:complete
MGTLSKIFGSGDVISKGLDLLDSLHTSAPEMIEAKTKAKVDMLSAYAPFKIAQRFLALMFGATFIISYFIVLVLFFLERDLTQIQEIITSFKIDWIMLTIVGFYFGGGAFEGIVEKKAGVKK